MPRHTPGRGGGLLPLNESDGAFSGAGIIISLESVRLVCVFSSNGAQVGYTITVQIEAFTASVFVFDHTQPDVFDLHQDIGCIGVFRWHGVSNWDTEPDRYTRMLVICIFACVKQCILAGSRYDLVLLFFGYSLLCVHTNTSFSKIYPLHT